MARIEFCGGIGAGKSTCAALLADRWALPLVSERFESIPYWRLHYADPARYALEKDLSFLLSHADGMRSVDAPRFVCDFAMFQTVAYSAIAGNAADTVAVEAVHERMVARVGHPALLIRLRCATGVQLRRIRERGRLPELPITADYLRRLDAAIDAQIAGLPPSVQILEFDTTDRAASDPFDSPALTALSPNWVD